MSAGDSDCKRRRMDPTAVSEELSTFLATHMASFQCCAHDLAHCYRVANLSLQIAESSDPEFKEQYDLRVVYLAGLLHDVLDSKLVAPSEPGKGKSIEEQLVEKMNTCENLSSDQTDKIILIIKSIGYKNLIKPQWSEVVAQLPAEYSTVQDADLLDAIGSIGLTRVFSFGGKRNRPIFGFTDQEPDGVQLSLTPAQYAARAGMV